MSASESPLTLVDAVLLAQDSAPPPSVAKTWFAEPSAVGQESPSSCTAPLPLGAIAILPFAQSVIVIEPVVEFPV